MTRDNAPEATAQPPAFGNASPFPARSRERDPVNTALFVATGIAILALLAAIAAVLTMRAPVL